MIPGSALHILQVQNIFEEDLGFWRANALPSVDHLMIIAGHDHRVTRIIWDMADPEGAPYGESKVRVIVAPCDGKIEHVASAPKPDRSALSTEKPTVEGWWWWEVKAGDRYGDIYFQEDTLQPVRIYRRGWDENLCVQLNGSYDDDPILAHVTGRWTGPIPEPSKA